jgi:hypothetical protein
MVFQLQGLCNYQISKLLNYQIALGLSFFSYSFYLTRRHVFFVKRKILRFLNRPFPGFIQTGNSPNS